MDKLTLSTQDRHTLSDRIGRLIRGLSSGVYERENVIRLCMLTALANESVFLFGPPGIAKSMIAKRIIEAFDHSQYFEYLMTRFSTPEEVFGPISIQDLKDNGQYVRLVDGYLPTADVVFLDEIWKAGPAILNTLLTVINEKTFKNGRESLSIPLKLLITASNELPPLGSGLDALYDRMVIRLYLDPIQEKENFKSMLTSTSEQADIRDADRITPEELAQWQGMIDQVKFPNHLFEFLYQLKQKLDDRPKNIENYISDRRWKKVARLLKASAFFNGRDSVEELDFILLKNCLWQDLDSHIWVQDKIKNFILHQLFDQDTYLYRLSSLRTELTHVEKQLFDHIKIKASKETIVRQERWKIELNNAKRFSFSRNDHLIKLVELTLPSEGEVANWYWVDASELNKKIRSGKCEVYGYQRGLGKMIAIPLEINDESELMILRPGTSSVPLGLATTAVLPMTSTELDEKLKQCPEKLDNLAKKIHQIQQKVWKQSTHHFVDPAWVDEVDQQISQLVEQVTDLQKELPKIHQQLAAFYKVLGE